MRENFRKLRPYNNSLHGIQKKSRFGACMNKCWVCFYKFILFFILFVLFTQLTIEKTKLSILLNKIRSIKNAKYEKSDFLDIINKFLSWNELFELFFPL